ncbi:hypothetical protein EAE96_008945 [Botrytis aclada]|nr:hypothetical protein EAE96_008945 [Botrytis aclada]
MLPDDLASSYSSYKADTSMFTNWLFKSATACGYEMPITASPIEDTSIPVQVSNTQGRLKGKARKLAKESKERQKVQESLPVLRAPSKKYTITTSEIMKQEKFVIGKIELPQTIRKVLQRAIHARNVVQTDQGRSDRSHSNSMDIPCKTPRDPKDTGSSWTETFNSFQALDIEDCLEEDSEVEDVEGSSELNVNTQDTCELEEESLEMKMSMMIFYFFEDLHRIQDFLHGIWKRYKGKTIDLLSATLITNTAFELVRRTVIFYAKGLNTGKNPTQKMDLKEWLQPTPFDDFIYLSTARILMKYDDLCKRDLGYPIPSLPLRAAYISCPEILGTPYMDKKEKEDTLLSQLIIDLGLFESYNRLTKEDEARGPAVYAPSAADALTTGLLNLRDEGKISVTIVLASQIFLDLNEILGESITEAHHDWRRLASKGQRSLDSCLYLPKDTANAYWWDPRDVHTIKKVLEINSRYTDPTMFIRLKECFVESYCPGPDWGRAIDDESTYTTGLVNRLSQESSNTSVLQPTASKNTYCTEQGNLPGVQFSKDLVLTNTYTRFPECCLLGDWPAPDWSKKWLGSIGAVTKASDAETHNQKLIEGVRQLDIRLIRPHSDSKFFYTHNPVYCGMVALRLSTSYNEAGLAHSDFHLVITFMAHLYEECSRNNFIQKSWPAMETLIKIHRKDIFDGNVPKSADEAYNIFSKNFFPLQGLSSRIYEGKDFTGLENAETIKKAS